MSRRPLKDNKKSKDNNKDNGMFYIFKCENGHTREYCISIKFGPPKHVVCDCKKPMYQELGGNFVLRGDGWPGKDLKSKQYKSGEAREQTDQMLEDDKTNQRVVDDVLKVRRKGKKAVQKFKEENPNKFRQYKKAMKDGYRGKDK